MLVDFLDQMTQGKYHRVCARFSCTFDQFRCNEAIFISVLGKEWLSFWLLGFFFGHAFPQVYDDPFLTILHFLDNIVTFEVIVDVAAMMYVL